MPEPFGRFLVRRGRCSNQELLDALMELGRLRPPALAIAVQLGFLSAAQALDVLGEMPDDRHPELPPHALTAAEHRLVAKEVRSRTPHVGQVLLMNGLITGVALRDELVAYREVVRAGRSAEE